MEKVSIIVPVYNAAEGLARCADSILGQDYPDWELILVDDGSRDGSPEIADEYARRDARVRVIHQPNGGVSAARNRGLAEASGTYVRFVDADDWIPMDSVKLLVREMEQTGAELAVGDFYRVVEENVSRKGSIEKGGVLTLHAYADRMLGGPADLYYGVLWNKLYRRDIIEENGLRMDESVRYSEDMIFNLEYLPHVKNVAVLKAPVSYYRYTKGSLVDQSLTLAATVRMKTNVIGKYDAFFRNIFEPDEYLARQAAIYGFLLAVSRDSLSIPFLPGTRRLGRETGEKAAFDPAMPPAEEEDLVLRARLMRRYRETVAKKHKLERADVQILSFLMEAGRACTAEETAACTGLPRLAVMTGMLRLAGSGLAAREPGEAGAPDRYRFAAPQLAGELEQVRADYEAVCLEGFTEAEKEAWRRMTQAVSENIRRHLAPEWGREEEGT